MIDLASVPIDELLRCEKGTTLAAAVQRIRDEADAPDSDDVVSAFNSSLDD